MEILRVTLGRNVTIFVTGPHFTCTLAMKPSLKPYESAAAVSMEILGVTLEQESHYICNSPALYIHPGVGTSVRPGNLQQLFPWGS